MTPEIVGTPMLAAGESVKGLGFDLFVPTTAPVNSLVVVCGFRFTGTGDSTVIPRLDTDTASLTGFSFTGTPSSLRMSLQQFRNAAPGIHRVSVEGGSGGLLEKAFLVAVLLGHGGVAASMGGILGSPFGAGSPSATSRLTFFYWSYGATAIAGASAPSILSVNVLPGTLGALEVGSIRGTGAAPEIGVNPTNEASGNGVYAIVPYSAS